MANADFDAAYISWNAPSNNGGSAIDSYLVTIAGTSASITAGCGQCTSVYFSGLTNGRTYTFSVRAHNSAGYGKTAYSNSVTPSAGPPPAVPSAPSAAAATTVGYSATVTWTPSQSAGGSAIDRYQVIACDFSLGVSGALCPSGAVYAGAIDAAPISPSATYQNLSNGHRYQFWVQAHNSSGYSAGSSLTAPVTISNPACSGSQPCLTVDGTTDNGPTTTPAEGFLHGLNANTSPYVGVLKPQFWRVSADYGDDSQAKSYGAKLIEVLSDDWYAYSQQNYRFSAMGGALPPWECWSCYSSFIQQEVKNLMGTVDYFDIVNEPGANGYYGPNQNGTASLYLQQLKVAYNAIRAVDPSAKIIGPSTGDFVDSVQPTQPSLLSFDALLSYAEQNNLNFTALSWHEIDPTFTTSPVDAKYDTDQLHFLLSEHPSLGNPQVFVDEFSPPASAELPGWTAGWLTALESANVNEANRTCYDVTNSANQSYNECNAGVVDGLLTYDEQHAEPNDWVHYDYATMSGTRVATTTSDQDVTAYATKNDTTNQMSVLLGRHQSCTPGVVIKPACNEPSSATPPPAGVNLTVNYPYPANTVTVNVTQVPNAGVTSAGMNQVSQSPITVPVTAGTVTFTLPNVADGEAYQLQIQKAS